MTGDAGQPKYAEAWNTYAAGLADFLAGFREYDILVITPPGGTPWAQLRIREPVIEVEFQSNYYLDDPGQRWSDGQLARLAALGWAVPPDPIPDGYEESPNIARSWWSGEAAAPADGVVAVLRDVLAVPHPDRLQQESDGYFLDFGFGAPDPVRPPDRSYLAARSMPPEAIAPLREAVGWLSQADEHQFASADYTMRVKMSIGPLSLVERLLIENGGPPDLLHRVTMTLAGARQYLSIDWGDPDQVKTWGDPDATSVRFSEAPDGAPMTSEDRDRWASQMAARLFGDTADDDGA